MKKLRVRIAKRIKIIREHCLGVDIETASRILNTPVEDIKKFESDEECCTCGYFINLCDNAGVCPDGVIHFPDKENPEGLMRWSFEHYLYKLNYTSIDTNGELAKLKEPDLMKIMNQKDYKNITK